MSCVCHPQRNLCTRERAEWRTGERADPYCLLYCHLCCLQAALLLLIIRLQIVSRAKGNVRLQREPQHQRP